MSLRSSHLCVVLSLLLVAAWSPPVSAQSLTGVWKTGTDTEGGYLLVAFEPCDGGTCGRITSAFDKAGTPQPDYEHIDRKIIWDIAARDTDMFDAVVWAPDTEKTYQAKLEFKKLNLKVSGCVLGGLVCRSQLWSRQQ